MHNEKQKKSDAERGCREVLEFHFGTSLIIPVVRGALGVKSDMRSAITRPMPRILSSVGTNRHTYIRPWDAHSNAYYINLIFICRAMNAHRLVDVTERVHRVSHGSTGRQPPVVAGDPRRVVGWGVAVEGADVAGVAALEGFGEFGGGGVVARADTRDKHGRAEKAGREFLRWIPWTCWLGGAGIGLQ